GIRLPSQSSEGRPRSQRSRTDTSREDWAPLFGLEAVHLVLDAGAVHDGFTIKSAKFQFRRGMGEELHGLLPNLLEWVLPKYKNKVFCWVQDHVNSYMHGYPSNRQVLNHVQVLQPGTDDGCLLVGELEMVEMSKSQLGDDTPPRRHSPRSGVGEAGEEKEEEEEDVFMHLEMRRFFFR
ncbi:unnamed protein product, partial [Symbiodinium sp. CCMP2456]